jgi:hypothetical protein
MSCSGLADVISGVALICGPSSGPTFRAHHTMMIGPVSPRGLAHDRNRPARQHPSASRWPFSPLRGSLSPLPFVCRVIAPAVGRAGASGSRSGGAAGSPAQTRNGRSHRAAREALPITKVRSAVLVKISYLVIGLIFRTFGSSAFIIKVFYAAVFALCIVRSIFMHRFHLTRCGSSRQRSHSGQPTAFCGSAMSPTIAQWGGNSHSGITRSHRSAFAAGGLRRRGRDRRAAVKGA